LIPLSDYPDHHNPNYPELIRPNEFADWCLNKTNYGLSEIEIISHEQTYDRNAITLP